MVVSGVVAVVAWFVAASLAQSDVDWSDGHRVGGVHGVIAAPFRAIAAVLAIPFAWSSPSRPADFHPVLLYGLYAAFWAPIFYGLYLVLRSRRRKLRHDSRNV